MLKKELQEALNNIDIVCSNAPMTRQQHIALAGNINLIKEELEKGKDNEPSNDIQGSDK